MKRRKYTGDTLMTGTLQIEEPAPVFRDYNVVVYIKTGAFAGFFADLETTKDIIAQLAAIVAEHEKRKPTLRECGSPSATIAGQRITSSQAGAGRHGRRC